MKRDASVDFNSSNAAKNRVVQVCFGKPHSGGPATALMKMLAHSHRSYPVVWQSRAAGGISLPLMREMAKEIRVHKPDLVHVRGLGNEGFHGVVAARMAGAKNILLSVNGTQRDLESTAKDWRVRFVSYVLEPMSLNLASHVVAICEFAAQRDFLMPYRHKMLPPVPNGVELVDPDMANVRKITRASLGIPEDQFVAIIVSRLTREKGYEDLSAALRLSEQAGRKFDLVVVGDGDGSGQIRAGFENLKDIRVHFVGHQQNVGLFLSLADAFVFPTWHENLSNALLEAMAHGLPVIATSVGGNTEVIGRGGGLLIPPHDPPAIAEALAKLHDQTELRSGLGLLARKVAQEHYSLDAMVRGWEATYDRILQAQV